MKLSPLRNVFTLMRPLLTLFALAPALAQAQPIPLAVEGYGDASVVVPEGEGARPVVVAGWARTDAACACAPTPMSTS